VTELNGKVTIVTGASRGIGRAIALTLARSGARVVLAARTEALLEEAAVEVRAAGRSALVCTADLREEHAAPSIVERTIAEFGRLDIVVNNAGATKRGDFLALPDHDWQDGFALKFFGAVRLCRAAWPYLQQARGAVVNIAGIGGRTPGAEFAIGGSVNAAILSFTKALAEKGIADGIQVNAINPGRVWTDRLRERVRVCAEKAGVDRDAAAARLLEEAKISRFGEPEDVANLVAFLVSARGRWMQGSLIDLDGGETKTI
jgi:3-oxoacyl-[acyl-carrier protein] reductase